MTPIADVRLEATITCPECGRTHRETMPTNACVWYWDCPNCAALIRPKAGDCCVFCSFADVACPPIQVGDSCCEAPAST